jgi:ribulose-5-phosphate 4-epimerase/fuculose-1-phosphate aldolase
VPFDWNLPPIAGLTPQGEIALALRILHTRGYDEDFFGHITVRQPDGSYLTNPWEILWTELRASQIVSMDWEGRKLGGDLSVTPGVNLHVDVRRYVDTPATNVIIHQHPRYATLWATRAEVPPIYDQSGAWVGEDVYLLDEFEEGEGISEEHARSIADARCGLLSKHGVLILGETVCEAAFRAVVLEQRARQAWFLEDKGVKPLDRSLVDALVASLGPPRFAEKWWHSHLDREARRAPEALH